MLPALVAAVAAVLVVVAVLVGVAVRGGLAPLRARAAERALDRGTAVAVPRLVLLATAVVVTVSGVALVAVLSPR